MVYPSFYPSFHCIADRCRHTCCKGWEIDVDEETMEKYRAFEGPLGERLRASVSEEDTPHFVTDGEERCPFLRADGLCDLILSGGEGMLCEICRMHPRYVANFCGREEIGLGLCCEEAVRLALSSPDPINLTEEEPITDADPFEEELWEIRAELMRFVQEESVPYGERVKILRENYGIPDFSAEEWKDLLSSLEILDSTWKERLSSLGEEKSDSSRFDRPLSRMTALFFHRYFPRIWEEEEIAPTVYFSLVSAQIVSALCRAKEDCTEEDLYELVRAYSSEIEYSEENVSEMFRFCGERILS